MRLKNVSLIGLFAIVACAAMAISHVITSLRLSRANEELTSLRHRLALTDVPDTNLVAARSLPSASPNAFGWAVRVPAGIDYKLRIGIGDVSPNGLPLSESATSQSIDLVPDRDTHEAYVAFTVAEGERGYGAIHVDAGGIEIGDCDRAGNRWALHR